MAKLETDGWKPVLRGRIYCSPRCGFNCNKAAYDKAVADSDALAERLGDGWTAREAITLLSGEKK